MSTKEHVRGDDAWRIAMARTGACFAPPPNWALPEHRNRSPYTPEELAGSFEALQEIFTPARARRIFRRDDDSMWQLFVDPWVAQQSRLVSLGLDARVCGAARSKSLVDALSGGRGSFEGACSEIAVYAALKRAEIPSVHEPLRRFRHQLMLAGQKPKNPDFVLDLGLGYPVFVEVKRAREGRRLRNEREWLIRFSFGAVKSARVPANIEMLDAYAELEERDDGAWMDANIDRLVAAVDEVKLSLSTSEIFPAVAVVEDCIRVEVKGPPDSVATGGVLGLATNSMREARRVIRNLVTDEAVAQLPVARAGLVLIDPGFTIDPEILGKEIERWFTVEGDLYRNVLGILVLAREYYSEPAFLFTRVLPIWRQGAPGALRESPAWELLSYGLSWQELRRVGLCDESA